jgi:hypothetical protein
VGSADRLVTALRRLAAALRSSRNPRAELAAARKVFADTAMVPPPAGGRPETRRDWWHMPGR